MTPTPAAINSFLAAIAARDLPRVRALGEADPALLAAHDPRSFGSTALIRAVGTDDRDLVDILLDLGADIDQRSDWWAGSFGVLDSATDEMSEHLLGRGATLTPHAAARLGKIDRLGAMLEADPGAVHSRGGDGQTPLHFARTAAIVDLLLEHGAAIDALDIDHASTPAQWRSPSAPEVAGHLVRRGAAADPFLAAQTGSIALLERLVAEEPGGIDTRVTRERFPAPPPAAGHIYLYTIGEGSGLLHAAAQTNQAESIRWLARHGADPAARGGYDDATPLHTAAWSDNAAAAAALLDAGADIDALSGSIHDNEPIGWAIVSGALATVRILLERKATVRDVHRQDAHKGCQGAFRELQSQRPIAAWEAIERLLR